MHQILVIMEKKDASDTSKYGIIVCKYADVK